jgi:outer membrane protein TolC
MVRILTGRRIARAQRAARLTGRPFCANFSKNIRKLVLWGILASGLAHAEIYRLTLERAIELASRQNPDVILARLDEHRAEAGIVVAKDPFRPKVYVGSGDAYIYGYPNSIEGSAPSLFQLQTQMSIYNRPKSYAIASARETARGSQAGAQSKAEEIAYRVADLFLTASQILRQHSIRISQLPELQKIAEIVSAAVNEGRELSLDLDSAQLNLQISQQQIETAELDLDYYEMMLAVAVGYSAVDRVKPLDSEFSALAIPLTEGAAADTALSNNKELWQMRSNLLARQMDLRSSQAERVPQVDLVAQYAYFLKRDYIQYFPSSKFQANNVELGVSLKIPIFVGSAAKGEAEQATIDMQKIRLQMDQVRNRIVTDTHRSYQQWQKAETLRKLSELRLDYARKKVSLLLAQNTEGRAPLRGVEQARLDESDALIALYDAETQLARAKFAILRQTGSLLAALRASESSTQAVSGQN